MRYKIILPCHLVCLSTITCGRDAILSMPRGLRLGLPLLTPTFSAEPATHTGLGWASSGCSESYQGFPGGAAGKEPAYQCRKLKRYLRYFPTSGRSPRGRYGNPLQYSCLEHPMDRGAWRAPVHRVAQSQTRLKRLSTHTVRLLPGVCK